MKKFVCLWWITLFLILFGSLSYAQLTDEEIEKQKLKAIEQINKSLEPVTRFERAITFPSHHPSNAISGTASWGHDDEFNLYIWRENGEVWIEIEPTLGTPFICGSSFIIIQNGIQYDTVKLETYAGDSQCGDVYIPSVFRLTQWSFYSHKADLNQEFVLIFEGVYNTYRFNVPGDDSTHHPSPPPEPSPDITDSDNDGVIDSWDNCPNTPANSYVDKNGCPFSGEECPETPTISEDLRIHIPVIKYQTPFGTWLLWADFEIVQNSDDELLWRLSDFGVVQ